MGTPQEMRLMQRKAELEGGTGVGGALAAYEESGRMPEAMFGQQKSSTSLRQQPRRHRRRGAPGLLACSRSSDEIQRASAASVALSPVTGPGATSFSSVASAFDFQHHIGSDPASELLVLKHILTRECLLSRLEAVCGQLRKRFQLLPAASAESDGGTAQLGEGGEGVVDLLSKMRGATVAVIEAISTWRKDMAGYLPSAFVWHGENYLLKITNDLNFLAGVQPLVNTLKMHPARFCRNPLMLPQTLDEQRRDGELHEESGRGNVSPGAGRRRHLYQAAQVLLDEESLEGKRDLLRQRQDTTKSAGSLTSRGDTSPELSGRQCFAAGGTGHGVRSCPTTSDVLMGVSQDIDGGPVPYSPSRFSTGRGQAESDDAFRRRQQLSTWYEEARSQLVSLSTSPADEEYFLRSRRFWSKEELGETGGGCSPPPPHRRPPGTLARGSKSSASTAHAVAGREASGTERRFDGEGNDRADLSGERLSNRQQRGLPPSRRTRSSQGARRLDGQEAQIGGSARRTHGGDGDRGGADVWSRPDRFGGGNSAALSCITVDDIEQVLREVDPLPATVAVCAAVVFLLSPEDQPPADFLWPQGFEAVALPVEDFLWRLHEASGSTASSTKARFLAPVLQREHLVPEVIERQGSHAIASLCAWALEELQVCEEFAEWSETALEPWYETQLVPSQPDAPESNDVVGCEVRLVYKALHALPYVGGSYVISLFEDKSERGGFIVRAFDRAKKDAFWLTLSRAKVASFGENTTRSSATLVAALARRLKVKLEVGTGKARLVLPPAKKAESSSEKKSKNVTSTGAVNRGDEVAAETAVRAGAEAGTARSASPSLPRDGATTTPVPECPAAAQANPRALRRSHPPATRGSKVQNLGPLVENEGDVSDCSAEGVRDTRPAPRTGGGNKDAVVVAELEKGYAFEETPVKAEEEGTASDLTGARQEQPVPQAANASGPELALPETRCEPRDDATSSDGVKGEEGVREGGVREAELEESGSYADDFVGDGDEDKAAGQGREEGGARMGDSGPYADDFVGDGDEDKAAGLGGKVVGRVEESVPYTDDFVGDGDEDKAAGLGGKVVGRVEESGPYADDFVGDGDKRYDHDSSEEDLRGSQRGVEDQGAADASTASSGGGITAPDVCGDSTTSPTDARTTSPADVPAQESAVEGLGGADRGSDESPKEAATEEEVTLLEPRQTRGEGAITGVDSGGDKPTETELEEGYEDELLVERVERRESAQVEVAESTQPVVVSTNSELSHPPPTDDTTAEDDGVSTRVALQSQESATLAKEGEEPAQQTQPDNDGRRRSSGETANNLTALDGTTTDASDGCSRVDTDGVAEVAGREVGNDSQRQLLAEDNERVVQGAPIEPVPTRIVVDPLGNVERGSTHEGSASDIDEANTASKKLAASKLASAAVASAMESALEIVSERNEVDLTEVGAHDGPGTEVAEAGLVGEDRALSAGVAASADTAKNQSPRQRRRSSERGAQLTGRPPEDGLEESFEDDTGENDAAKSAGDGTIASSEFSSFVEGENIPPSLSEQDSIEGPSPGGIGGDQAEADEETRETRSAVEKVVPGSLRTEYEDFEDEFDEDFEEDVEEDIAPGRPKAERDDVGSGVADSEVLGGSEGLDPREPTVTETAAAAGGEKPVDIPPPVEEFIGNQDEDLEGNDARRKSVDVDQVEPAAGPPGDEFEDDFDEDDFEDP